jgi:hypothetical protein
VLAEQIQASADNGVLQILVPKAEEAKPKRIQVRPGPTEVPAASNGRRKQPGHTAQLSPAGGRSGPAPPPRLDPLSWPASQRRHRAAAAPVRRFPPQARRTNRGPLMPRCPLCRSALVTIGFGLYPDRHLHQLQRPLDPRRPPAAGHQPGPGALTHGPRTLAHGPGITARQQPNQHAHARSPPIAASCFTEDSPW